MANKKGSGVFDVIYILVVLFIIAIITLIAVKVYNEWSAGSNLQSETAQNVMASANITLTTLDGIFAFVIVMLFILVLVSAFMINTHPVFFIVTLIMLILALILAVAFSNIFETVSEESLTTEAARYPIMSYLMNNLPFIILIVIVTTAVVLYAGKIR